MSLHHIGLTKYQTGAHHREATLKTHRIKIPFLMLNIRHGWWEVECGCSEADNIWKKEITI